MISQDKIKIFNIYYKPDDIYRSDIILPIQAGAEISEHNLDMLKDNTGDNISSKNKTYGELTAWYWVWKNYLKANLDLEYVGFCHYRRLIDLSSCPAKKAFKKVWAKQFLKIIKNYYKSFCKIEGCDVILPGKRTLKHMTTLEEYLTMHSREDWDKFVEIMKEKYPEYLSVYNDVANSQKQYHCLNFIMKKDLFENFMQWSFDILFELEKRCNWSDYNTYLTVRAPAYLIERFFNVWLQYQIIHNDIVVLDRKGCFLREKNDSLWIVRKLKKFGVIK